MKRFGIYVHIPYCLQICTYCDFVKFESRDLPPSKDYVALLQRELATRSMAFGSRELTSIYFGGGTPSLFSPEEILAVIDGIANEGFSLKSGGEVTLEVNPGTINETALARFLEIGVTRFSVGAQTFDESLLALTGRKHAVSDTMATLEMLKKHKVNYSFDLLFGLPGQRLNGVKTDVAKALEFEPSHLSAYNLTVPIKHPLNVGRASDDEQAEMFEAIEADLEAGGLLRYEVSNFAKPGFESEHNRLYWSDDAYWGLGVGAHSYIPRGDTAAVDAEAPWGIRFWNPATINSYAQELERAAGALFWSALKEDRIEKLKANEALTDFCHTALRSQQGLSIKKIEIKFGVKTAALLRSRLAASNLAPFLTMPSDDLWVLSRKGQAMADRVFEALTFLKDDGIEV